MHALHASRSPITTTATTASPQPQINGASGEDDDLLARVSKEGWFA